MLPFSPEQFIAVFAEYNTGVWPAQIVAYALGVAMVALLLRRSPASSRSVGLGLSAMWLWTGIAYHWLYFASINNLALIFGALFVLQGAIFLHAAVRRTIGFGVSAGPRAWFGWALVGYAAVLYPLLGVWLGHAYPQLPMFGITPCPVTIFTFGLLLLTASPVSPWMFAIPLLWSVIGGSAAFLLGVAQDWPLLLSGVGVGLMLLRRGGPLRSSTAT